LTTHQNEGTSNMSSTASVLAAVLADVIDREFPEANPSDVGLALAMLVGEYFSYVPDPSDRASLVSSASQLSLRVANDAALSRAH
jgi:hypothetical protein